MRKNLLSAFVILFISIVCFFVYSDIRTNNDIVNIEQLEVLEDTTRTELATNDVDEEEDED